MRLARTVKELEVDQRAFGFRMRIFRATKTWPVGSSILEQEAGSTGRLLGGMMRDHESFCH
jgi:hypothetical protein